MKRITLVGGPADNANVQVHGDGPDRITVLCNGWAHYYSIDGIYTFHVELAPDDLRPA